MARVTLVRYTTKPGRSEENERLARTVFAELKATRPDGVTYSFFRDGDDFVHLFVNVNGDDSSVVTELPSFKAYVAEIGVRCVAPPEQTRFNFRLVESYGLPKAMAPA